MHNKTHGHKVLYYGICFADFKLHSATLLCLDVMLISVSYRCTHQTKKGGVIYSYLQIRRVNSRQAFVWWH